MDVGNSESINAWRHSGVRPLCQCCCGGKYRKGKTMTKHDSCWKNTKNKRAKPKKKDHR